MKLLSLSLLLLLTSICVGVADGDKNDLNDPTYKGQASLNYINTWLIAGPFQNDDKNSGMDQDLISETTASPQLGASAGDSKWAYFDDRLFSRNYDDYQDLFSYFNTKLKGTIAPQIAYTHVYVYSPDRQDAFLRLGADSSIKAFLNGKEVAKNKVLLQDRDSIIAPVSLDSGWNRLLLKIGTKGKEPFGFYARFSTQDGSRVDGLSYSLNGPGDVLSIATQGRPDIGTGDLPTAWRDWPYVSMDAAQAIRPGTPDFGYCSSFIRLSQLARSSRFLFFSSGGQAPYRWSLEGGQLPEGITLELNGELWGTPKKSDTLQDYHFTVSVRDAKNKQATKDFTLSLKERPNLWYQNASLVALIHRPETLTDPEILTLADTMKREGYQLGMPISYNNGDSPYMFPSLFDPKPPFGDVMSKYKTALLSNGIRSGFYVGMNSTELNPHNGGSEGIILVLAEIMDKYNPSAFYFDWAGTPGFELDALFSMIRSKNPDTLIGVNGVTTLGQGDWDVTCLEALGAAGPDLWDYRPFPIEWPKTPVVETWRHLADPNWPPTKGYTTDAAENLKLAISIIGEGFVVDLDHTGKGFGGDAVKGTLEEAGFYKAHAEMANWASPAGMPPLYTSYTNINRGPLHHLSWGYMTQSLDGNIIYLHFIQNSWGKTGLPKTDRFVLNLSGVSPQRMVWMNENKEIPFKVGDDGIAVTLTGIPQDKIDTIVKMELNTPYKGTEESNVASSGQNIISGPVNVALNKSSMLLSPNGDLLPPSGAAFAPFGVDGTTATAARAGLSYAWTYKVDLQKVYALKRIKIAFLQFGYATEYQLSTSEDGEKWDLVEHVRGSKGEPREFSLDNSARYIRVRAIKPDGPGQPGGQMSIAELEAYEQ